MITVATARMSECAASRNALCLGRSQDRVEQMQRVLDEEGPSLRSLTEVASHQNIALDELIKAMQACQQ